MRQYRMRNVARWAGAACVVVGANKNANPAERGMGVPVVCLNVNQNGTTGSGGINRSSSNGEWGHIQVAMSLLSVWEGNRQNPRDPQTPGFSIKVGLCTKGVAGSQGVSTSAPVRR